MAAKPQRDSKPDSKEASRDRLPFEPAKNRKQPEKKEKQEPVTVAKAEKSEKPRRNYSKEDVGVPDFVSKRMVRRMAWFCGVPTLLGISTFIVSYLVISNDLIELPHAVVVLISMGFFGLSVLGLSYGVLSASWEEAPGSLLGVSEFTTNLGRMTEAWRSAGKKS